jgi:hypothetical protein
MDDISGTATEPQGQHQPFITDTTPDGANAPRDPDKILEAFLERVGDRLQSVTRRGGGAQARCPAHDDENPSLSIDVGSDGRILIHCHAGCPVEQVVDSVGLTMADLFAGVGEVAQKTGDEPANLDDSAAPTEADPGCTLAAYAERKKLPLTFLRTLGLREITYENRPAVRIPYLDATGQLLAVQFRVHLSGAGRLRWRRGDRATLYGQDRLAAARAAGYVVLVEGASDSHTLWFHDIPAAGLPSAATPWDERWTSLLDDIPTIYVLLEPDQGGIAVRRWLATASIRHRVRLVRLDGPKDVSDLHVQDPAGFRVAWQTAVDRATSWADEAKAAAEAEAGELRGQCETVAKEPDLLAAFIRALERRGLVGERRAAKLIYLAVTTRVFDRGLVSVAIKGPSSAGKSVLVKHVLDFFPPEASYELSAMSERALVYNEEPLAHRFLVLFEAAALARGLQQVLTRSFLSEGRLKYLTVIDTPSGPQGRWIEREGPIGLVTTTTAVKLHHEHETRLFSVPVTDTAAQTRRVLRQQGREAAARTGVVGESVDLSPWQALQRWLAHHAPRVRVPYAKTLADMLSDHPVHAVRLRLDFPAVLSLIKAHALLHHISRHQDATGTILAVFRDYTAVRALVADLIADGVEASVPRTVRGTVEALRTLGAPRSHEAIAPNCRPITVTTLARHLGLDKSSAWRRVQDAISRGYVENLQTRPHGPAQLILGDPLPVSTEILPAVEDLRARHREQRSRRTARPVHEATPDGSRDDRS